MASAVSVGKGGVTWILSYRAIGTAMDVFVEKFTCRIKITCRIAVAAPCLGRCVGGCG